MIHLIYISAATKFPSEDELIELLKQSRARNLKQHITGMLLYSNATYMQVLEGSAEDVHQIFQSIQNDSRNTAVVKLVEEEITQRNFPDWSMGFKNLENTPPDELPGFVDIFNGKLDKEIATNNKPAAINILMSFAKNI